MEFYKIVRELRRHRILVGIVIVGAALIGLLLAYKPGFPPKSRQYQVAIASSDILVDTSNSQVVDVGGHGPDLLTLAGRANLLGNLMTVGPLQEAIAESAGVPPEDLVVVPPANAETPGVSPAAVKSSHSRSIPKEDETVLTLSTDDTLPILHVVAQAPDEATAGRLATGTIVELRRYLQSVAASQEIPAARQIVVRRFGAPLVSTVTRGLPRSVALLVTVVLALLGCLAIVGGSAFVRNWKRFEEAEEGSSNGRVPSPPVLTAPVPVRAAANISTEKAPATESAGLRFPAGKRAAADGPPPVRLRPKTPRST